MKLFKLLLFLLLVGEISAQSDQRLEMGIDGIKSYIIEIDTLSAQQLYYLANDWVKEAYRSPDDVIQATFENKKIRVSGLASNLYWYSLMGVKYYYNLRHTITISFKDGRCKFDYDIDAFLYDDGSPHLLYYSKFYDNKGNLRGGKNYKDAIISLQTHLKEVSISFNNYMYGKTQKLTDDW